MRRVKLATGPERGPAALLRHSVFYGFARLGLSALDVVLLPFYARVLSPSDLGLVGVATSVLAVLGVIYTLGFDGAVGPLYYSRPPGSQARRAVIGGWLAATTAGGLVCAVVLTLVGPSPFGGFLTGVTGSLFVLTVWAAFFNLFLTAWLNLLRLYERSGTYLVLSFINAVLRVAATVVALVVLRRGAEGWAEACALTALITAALALAALRHEVGRFSPSWILRESLPFAVPLFAHQAAGWLSQSAGRLVLNQLTTLQAVAVYQVALSVGQALGLVTTAVNFAYAPAFMSAAGQSPEDAGRRFGAFASDYLAALVCIAVLGALGRDYVIGVLASSKYLVAAGLVPIVLASALVQGFYYVVVNPIMFRRRSVQFLPLVTGLGAVVGVGGTYLLVPRMGVAGAAWASLAAGVVIVVLAYPISQQAVPMTYHRGQLGGAVVLGLATVLVSLAAPVLGWPRLPVALVLATAFLYAVVKLGILRLSVYREMMVAAFPSLSRSR